MMQTSNKRQKRKGGLQTAARKGDTACVWALLAAGKDPDVQDESGYTALMLATREGHLDCVQAMLDTGADLTIQTEEEYTTIALADIHNYPDIVRAIREQICRPNPLPLPRPAAETSAYSVDSVTLASLAPSMQEAKQERYVTPT